MTSQEHCTNGDRIDRLEDLGILNEDLAKVLNWVNNLEETARQIVGHYRADELEECRYVFEVVKTYGKTLVRYAKKYRKEAEFGIGCYNAILREANIGGEYMLGGEQA